MQSRTSHLQRLGEREHVLRRPAEPTEPRDDESVTLMKSVERLVENRPRRSRSGHTEIHVEIVAANAGGEKVGLSRSVVCCRGETRAYPISFAKERLNVSQRTIRTAIQPRTCNTRLREI